MKNILTAFILSMVIAQAQTVPTQQEPLPPSLEQARREAAENTQPSSIDAALPRIIQCQFECIELSHEEATNLLFQRKQSLADATNLRKELQDMVAQKKAKVVDTMMVVARSGQKATTESILEYVYPTEYSLPSLPCDIKKPNEITPDYIKNMEWLRKPPTPTSFEPRNVGGTLEVEPTLGSDNKIIELRFAWEIIDHQGEKTWLEYKDSLNNTYKIEMPKFYVKRISTSVSTAVSTYTLVSMFDPQDAQGVRDTTRKWLVFAKCEVQVVR